MKKIFRENDERVANGPKAESEMRRTEAHHSKNRIDKINETHQLLPKKRSNEGRENTYIHLEIQVDAKDLLIHSPNSISLLQKYHRNGQKAHTSKQIMQHFEMQASKQTSKQASTKYTCMNTSNTKKMKQK